MKAILKIKNATKAQVLECCFLSFNQTAMRNGEVWLHYYAKKYIKEDLENARTYFKEKLGLQLDYEISTKQEDFNQFIQIRL